MGRRGETGGLPFFYFFTALETLVKEESFSVHLYPQICTRARSKKSAVQVEVQCTASPIALHEERPIEGEIKVARVQLIEDIFLLYST